MNIVTMRHAVSRRSFRQPLIVLSFILVVLALSALYVFPFGEFARDSDQANSFLQAQSMASGDWTLRGWWMASPTFWTSDVPMQAILIWIIGPRPIIMLLVPAFIWASVVGFSILLLRRNHKWSAAGALLIITVLGLPILRGNEPMQMITRSPMHISTVLFLLALFYFVARSLEDRRTFVSVACCAGVTAMGVASDPLILVLGVPTVALVVAWDTLSTRKYSNLSLIVAVVAGALIAKLAIGWITANGGFYAFGAPLAFVPIERLGRNIEYTLRGLLVLGGANFLGRGLEPAVPFLARLPLFLLIVGTVAIFGRRFLQSEAGAATTREISVLDKLLFAGLSVNIAEAMLSDLLLDAWSARYFLPTLAFGTILAARNLPKHTLSKVIVATAFATAIFFTTQSYMRKPPTVAVFDDDRLEIAGWLASQSLLNGYASYWSASIVTAASRGIVKSRPVDVERSKIVPRRWLAQEQWFNDLGSRRPFFVLLDKLPIELQLTEKPVVDFFGLPSRRVNIRNYEVLIYE